MLSFAVFHMVAIMLLFTGYELSNHNKLNKYINKLGKGFCIKFEFSQHNFSI